MVIEMISGAMENMRHCMTRWRTESQNRRRCRQRRTYAHYQQFCANHGTTYPNEHRSYISVREITSMLRVFVTAEVLFRPLDF